MSTKLATAAVILTIAVISPLGCRSRKPTPDDLRELEARYNAQLNQYMADCFGVGSPGQPEARVKRCDAEEAHIKPLQQQIDQMTRALAAQ